MTRPRTSVTSLPMGLTLPDVMKELEIGRKILGSEDKAIKAVAKAVAELPYTSAQQIDNRRQRRAPLNVDGRLSYRSLTGPGELLRFLVLEELDEFEFDEERAGRLLTEPQQLRCFIKQIVKTVLNHNSFYAAVGLTQIVCDYSAPQMLDMYSSVSNSRAEGKDWAACSRAKRIFERAIQRRFGERIELGKQGNAVKIVSRRPDASEVDLVRRSLLTLLPQVPAVPSSTTLADHIRAMFHESRSEMKRIHSFFDIDTFDRETRKAPSTAKPPAPAGQFDAHAWVPIIHGCNPDPGPSANLLTNQPDFDMDYFNEMLAKESGRQRRIAPGSLCIRVDGIDRGVLGATSLSRDLILEEGANIVRLVASDEEGEPVTFAAYVLTYDVPKTEYWEVDLGELGLLVVTFDYHEDETVEASFKIRSASDQQDHASSMPKAPSFVVGCGGTGLAILRRFAGAFSLYFKTGGRDTILLDPDQSLIDRQDDFSAWLLGHPDIVADSKRSGFKQHLTFALDDGTRMICRSIPYFGVLPGCSVRGRVNVFVLGGVTGGTGAGCLTFISDLIRSIEKAGKPLFVLDGQHRLSALQQVPAASTAIALALALSPEQSDDVSRVLLDLPAGCGKSYLAAHLVHELQSSLVWAIPGEDIESLIAGLCDWRVGQGAANDARLSVQTNSGAETAAIKKVAKGDLKEMNDDAVLREVMLAAQSSARVVLCGRADQVDDVVCDTLFRWSECVAAGHAPRDHRAWAFTFARHCAARMMSKQAALAGQPSPRAVEMLVDVSRSVSPLRGAVDKHAASEASALEEFAMMALRKRIPLEPLPRIVQREQLFSHVFVLTAILLTVLEVSAAAMLFQSFGLWPSGVALMMGIGAALCFRAWWTFGWSKRLFTRYHTAGRAIQLLTQSATGGRTDWRGVALVQRLASDLSALRYGIDNQGRMRPFERALNRAPEQFLVDALTEAGERAALKIANAIVAERPIVSSSHLAKVVAESLELPAPVVNALVCSTKPWRVASRC
jgi:hypothetical protein